MQVWGIRRNFLYLILSNFVSLLVAALLFAWFVNALYNGRYLQRTYIPTAAHYDIVAIGDSLTEGIGATQSRGYISLLSDHLNRPILNLAVRRTKTDQLMDQVTASLQYNPKLVIMTAGGNDMLWGYTHQTTFENLSQVFLLYREKGVDVIYLGVRTGILSDPYATELEQFVAGFDNVTFVPDILDGISFNPEFLFDPLHPNDEGHQLIARRVEPFVSSIVDRW